MTRLQQIELECPVCENRFSSHVVASTNAFGGKQTDFRECAAGTQPLPFLVHSCDRCGYTGERRDFTDDAVVTATLRSRVWEEIAPSLTAEPIAGSAKYERAAKVAGWQDAEPRRIGDLLLRAAWCSVDEGDSEAERYFRRLAAREFESALASWDGIPRAERAVFTYLVGELWRRVGDVASSRQWLARVEGEIVDAAAQRWVADAARQQMESPREWFA